MKIFKKFIKWALPEPPNIVAIERKALKTMIKAADNTHPNEMIGVLKSKTISDLDIEGDHTFEEEADVIEGFDIPPKARRNNTQVKFNPHHIPSTTDRVGIVHSHPNGVLRPSSTDLNEGFSIGNVHIIIGPPYDMNSWKAFSSKGEEIEIDVVESKSVEDVKI